jgi:aspartyl-tRNA(Asn)/glutamyl-tRNA(Gln) amidotransferase subunit B
VEEFGLKPDVARVLVANRASSELFERTVELDAPADRVANWITQDLAALVNEASIDPRDSMVGPEHLAQIIALIDEGTLSGSGGKQALEEAFVTGDSIPDIIERKGLRQMRDADALGAIVDEVIDSNPEVVDKFRSGNEGVIGFLVGQVMKQTGGSADPKLTQRLLRERIGGSPVPE